MPEDAGQVRLNHMRSAALLAAVLGVVVLPIAAAEATPVTSRQQQPSAAPTAQAPSAIAQALDGQYCGSAQTSAITGGTVTVQACVEQSAGTALGEAFVDNASTVPQLLALNLVRQDGTTVQVRCTIAARDASGSCSTGPTAVGAGTGAFDAIAELVGQGQPVSAGVVHVESGLVAAVPAAVVPAAPSTDAVPTGTGSDATGTGTDSADQ